jgi:hypothetical protein
MSIQNIKVIDNETLIITTTDDKVLWFKKDQLEGPERVWFDNILSCSLSLLSKTPK